MEKEPDNYFIVIILIITVGNILKLSFYNYNKSICTYFIDLKKKTLANTSYLLHYEWFQMRKIDLWI